MPRSTPKLTKPMAIVAVAAAVSTIAVGSTILSILRGQPLAIVVPVLLGGVLASTACILAVAHRVLGPAVFVRGAPRMPSRSGALGIMFGIAVIIGITVISGEWWLAIEMLVLLAGLVGVLLHISSKQSRPVQPNRD